MANAEVVESPLPLAEFDAAVSEAIYDPLDPGQTRLIHILPGRADDKLQCTTAVHSLQDDTWYEALSYVLGPETDPEDIELNHNPYKVTKKLKVAPLRLRRPDTTRTMWIGALAINQSDVAERNTKSHRRTKSTCVPTWSSPG